MHLYAPLSSKKITPCYTVTLLVTLLLHTIFSDFGLVTLVTLKIEKQYI